MVLFSADLSKELPVLPQFASQFKKSLDALGNGTIDEFNRALKATKEAAFASATPENFDFSEEMAKNFATLLAPPQISQPSVVALTPTAPSVGATIDLISKGIGIVLFHSY